MSSIDSRIVQMQFDNSQFEKGVSKSLKTLDELKKNLRFDEYEKELKGLQKSGDSFSLLKMANSVEEVSQKFSALGVIGKRVLENLTDKAVEAGTKFVKSLSIDQINAGFSRYADKTQAVQTIMAATGEDIGVISEQLNRLAMYADETSYNFVDMTSNIGKFTSMGVDLETATTAMMGISNWAAISGQHATEASRAMYNLSQALGMGAVKLMDWKSIENANMGTKEFKETAIETAKALGVLNKAGKTAKGTQVTFQNFRETLNQGWFSNEVLLETLKVYGEYGEEVMRVMAEKGISCAEAMKLVGVNTETLGEKAFRAAQEAVTFRQAIEATTDAVSTKWSMIFENIFGNYEEARVTWTNLANELYEIFVEPLNEANGVLSEWKNDRTIQGRTKLIEGLHDVMQALLGIIQAIGDGFSNIFPPVTAETLGKISDKVKEIGMNLKRLFAPKTFQRFTPQKIFKSFNLLGDLEDNIKRGMRSADVKNIQKRLNELGANLAEDGIFGPKTEKALNEFKKKYGLTVDGIYDEATHNKLAEAMGKLSYVETMKSVGEEIEKYPKGYKAVVGIFTGIAAVVKIVISAFKFLGKVIGTILSALSPIVDLVFTLGSAFLSAATAISDYISSGELFNGWLEKINGLIAPVKEEIQSFCDTILEFFGLKPEGNELNVEKGINGVGESAKKSKRPVSGFTHMLNKFRVMVAKTGVVEKLSNSFKTLKTRFKILKGPLKGLWKDFKTYLGKGLSAIFAAIPGILASATSGFLNFANTIIDKVINPLVAKLPGFIGKIRDFFKQLNPKFEGERSGLAKFFVGIGSGLKTAYESVKTWIGEKWDGIIKGVNGLIEQLSPDYEGERSSLAQWLIDFGSDLSAAWTAINEYVGEKWKSIIEGLTTLRAQLDPDYDEEANGERSGIAKFILSVRDGLRKAWASIKTWVGAKWKSIKDGISNLYTQLDPNYDEEANGERSGIAKFILSVRDSLRKAWVSIKTWVGAKWKSIKDGISNLYTQLDPNYDESVSGERSGIAKFILSVRDGLRKAWASIKTWVGAKWKSIKDGISNLYTQLDPNYDEEANGERSGIAKFILGVANGLEEAYNKISEWVGDKWTDIKNWFETEGPSIASSISSFANDFWVAVGVLFSGTGSGENGEAGNNLESVVLKIRSFLTNLVDALAILLTENPVGDTGLSTDFQKKLLGIRKFISQVFQAIMLLVTGESDKYGLELDDGIRNTILQISSWLKGILDAIKGLFGGGEESADGIEGLIGEKTSGLQSVMTSLTGSGGLFGAIGDINGVEKSGGGLGSTLKTAGIGLGITALIGKVSGFMKDLAVLRGGEDYARNQVPMLLQIAKVLKALAAAMLIIFAAVVVFSAMDSTALNNGISAIETIFDNIKVLLLELGGITLGDSAISNVVTGLIAKNGGKGSSSTVLSGIGQAIIGIGVAVAGITWAINNLPDGKEFEDGKKKVKEIFDILTNFISEIPFAAWLSGGLGFNLDFNTFKSFAEGIAILALVAHALSKIEDEDQFNEGVERVGVFIEGFKTLIADLAMMSAINNLTGGETKNFKMAGFIGVALAVAGLAYVANELSKIDDTQFNKGFERLDKIAGMLVGIPAVVTAIGAIGDLLGKSNTSFAQGAAGVAKAGGYAAIATGIVMALEGLLAGLAELVEWARDGEGKSLIEIIEEGGDVLGAISEGIGKFIGGFKSGFDKMQNAATDEEISGFGEAITSFADALSGTDYGEGELDSKIDAAIKTAQKIHDFFEGITENKLDDVNFQELSAFNSIVTNNNTQISDFGTAISGFASSLSVTGAVGLAVKVPFAVAAAQQIADFLEQLGGMNIEQKAGKITGLFAKKTNGETVFESVKQMGENLAEAATALGSVGGGTGNVGQTVGEAVRAIQGVVELLVSLDAYSDELPDVDEVDAWYGRGGKFQKLMWNVRQIGQSMSDYAGEMPTVDVSSYKSIQDGVNALKDIFTGNGPESFSTDNFLKDFDATAVRTKLSTFVSEVSSAVTDNASTLTESASQFNSSGSGLVDAMAGGMGSNTAANTAASTMASNAAAAAGSKTGEFETSGKNSVKGFINGLKDSKLLAQVRSAAAKVALKAKEGLNTPLEVKSPSRATMRTGRYFDLGFANGITKYGKAVDKSATGVAESSLNTLSGTFNSLSSLADDNIDVQPTIAPVVDMTNIRSASGYMNGVFADRSFGVRTSLMASSIATSAGTATKAGQFGSPDVVSAIHEMNSRIGILGEQISNLKMVVDTGALVGQMAGPMDAKFGTMATMKGRMG